MAGLAAKAGRAGARVTKKIIGQLGEELGEFAKEAKKQTLSVEPRAATGGQKLPQTSSRPVTDKRAQISPEESRERSKDIRRFQAYQRELADAAYIEKQRGQQIQARAIRQSQEKMKLEKQKSKTLEEPTTRPKRGLPFFVKSKQTGVETGKNPTG